jgi:hypothetical protein
MPFGVAISLPSGFTPLSFCNPVEGSEKRHKSELTEGLWQCSFHSPHVRWGTPQLFPKKKATTPQPTLQELWPEVGNLTVNSRG